MACLSTLVFAKTQDKAIDPYSQCIDDTIQQLKLGNINNAVVEICSTEPKLYICKADCAGIGSNKKTESEYKQLSGHHEITTTLEKFCRSRVP